MLTRRFLRDSISDFLITTLIGLLTSYIKFCLYMSVSDTAFGMSITIGLEDNIRADKHQGMVIKQTKHGAIIRLYYLRTRNERYYA